MGQYHMIVNLTKREFLYPRAFGDGIKLMEFGASGFGSMYALSYLLNHNWSGDVIAIAGDYEAEGDYDPKILSELGIDKGQGKIYSLCHGNPTLEDFPIYKGIKKTAKRDRVAFETSKTFKDVSQKTIDEIVESGWASRITYSGYSIEQFKVDYSLTRNHTVIYNQTTKEALDPRAFGDTATLQRYGSGYAGGTMTALAALLAFTCKGGARGGGDVNSDSPLVGSWAMGKISIESRSILKDSETKDISAGVREILAESGDGSYVITAGKVTRVIDW